MVVGTGRFATRLVRRLTTVVDVPLHLVQCGRGHRASQEEVRADDLVQHTYARTPTLSGPRGREDLQALLERWGPSVVVVATSHYSPYAGGGGGVPFGSSLAQQLPVALTVAEVAHSRSRPPLLLNACYPELVNTVCSMLELPFHAGLGNAQTLNWSEREDAATRVLGHHAHLGSGDVAPPLVAATDLRTVHEPSRLELDRIARRRALPRDERNAIGATAAGDLVATLVASGTCTDLLPGVGTFGGAVPVSLSLGSGAAALAEADVLLRAEDTTLVRARHRAASSSEGWTYDDGRLGLSAQAAAGMGVWAPPSRTLDAAGLRAWATRTIASPHRPLAQGAHP